MVAGGLTELKSQKIHNGFVKKFEHTSEVLGGLIAKFNIFLPPNHESEQFPILMFLSGLTCSEENFITKGCAIKLAAEKGIGLLCPDTSPRGAGVMGEDDGWDFGTGAGFYVNATTEGWKNNYQMFDYVNNELPSLVQSNFNTNGKMSVTGHSMGGHGALISFLKNPGKYLSCSAFSPICHPSNDNCQWGQKNFTGYLGAENKEEWKNWDAVELVKKYEGPKVEIMIDQGLDDGFLPKHQLQPEKFQEACTSMDHPLDLGMREGYDHSYYFIASFIDRHIEHHAKYLC